MFATTRLPLTDVLPFRGPLAALIRGPSSVPKHVARPSGKRVGFFLTATAGRAHHNDECLRIPTQATFVQPGATAGRGFVGATAGRGFMR